MSDFKLQDELHSIIAKNIINNQYENLYFKDLKSRFIAASANMVKYMGVLSSEDLIGKTDYDYFSKDHAIQAFNDEQEIIRTGKPLLGIIEQETWKDNYVSYVVTSKYPLYDHDGNIIGTWGHSVNVATTNIHHSDLKKPRLQEEDLTSFNKDSRTDNLTGLKNTKAFYEFINLFYQKALNAMRLANISHSLILVDMDSFSMINETFGSKYGDEALKFASNIIGNLIQDQGHLFRYSGDKFAILLEVKSYLIAKDFASSILTAFEKQKFEFQGKTIDLSASIGMSDFKESLPFGNIHDIINLTDKRLYAAKSPGLPTLIFDNSYQL